MSDEYEPVRGLNQAQIERLAIAFLHMNCWKWDDLCGEKPKDFDPEYLVLMGQAIL